MPYRLRSWAKSGSVFIQSSLNRSNELGIIFATARFSKWIILRLSQKMVAITLPADIQSLAFFGAYSPGNTHSFDCCLVTGVLLWIYASIMEWNGKLKKFRTYWTILVFTIRWLHQIKSANLLYISFFEVNNRKEVRK